MGSKVLLGIDPGTVRSGYGVLRVSGSVVECLAFGYEDLRICRDDSHRLEVLWFLVVDLVGRYGVSEVAIECPFLGCNARSFLKLSRAQGVVMASASSLGCGVFEYSPSTVKRATVGYGFGTKAGLARGLELLLKIKISTKQYDATDALAVAFTHFVRGGRGFVESGVRGGSRARWSAYVKGLGGG